ncbi:hypothetical protein CC78DRAFT_576835 [Lojkania enalia]|uniref:Uncharacterized protein n=1 Tax=Lojkania enalia TaxID=147567 RepID=A0A9P4N6R2_9PLEO|nr:hypothetical protein CC78DRAFT_576835 [Didymosphaeria enalia]
MGCRPRGGGADVVIVGDEAGLRRTSEAVLQQAPELLDDSNRVIFFLDWTASVGEEGRRDHMRGRARGLKQRQPVKPPRRPCLLPTTAHRRSPGKDRTPRPHSTPSLPLYPRTPNVVATPPRRSLTLGRRGKLLESYALRGMSQTLSVLETQPQAHAL